MARNRVGESTSDWKPTDKEIDADKVGIAPLLAKFEANYYAIKAMTAENDEIKAHMKRHGRNFEIKVGGASEWRVRSDGGFMPKEFKSAHPDKVAEYSVKVMKEVFDLEAFKAAEPALYEKFRAQRLEKINK